MTATATAPTYTSHRDRDVLRSFARRVDPSDAGAHNSLGVVYYNKGLYEEAVAAFSKALELDPRRAVSQRNLEIAYFATGFYDRRVAELRERLRARSDDREARWDLGRTYAMLGNFSEATREFTDLLKHHPDDLGALVAVAYGDADVVGRVRRALREQVGDDRRVGGLALALH